jgi:hypothetical protein
MLPSSIPFNVCICEMKFSSRHCISVPDLWINIRAVKMTVLWVVDWHEFTNVFEVCTASIIRAMSEGCSGKEPGHSQGETGT